MNSSASATSSERVICCYESSGKLVARVGASQFNLISPDPPSMRQMRAVRKGRNRAYRGAR